MSGRGNRGRGTGGRGAGSSSGGGGSSNRGGGSSSSRGGHRDAIILRGASDNYGSSSNPVRVGDAQRYMYVVYMNDWYSNPQDVEIIGNDATLEDLADAIHYGADQIVELERFSDETEDGHVLDTNSFLWRQVSDTPKDTIRLWRRAVLRTLFIALIRDLNVSVEIVVAVRGPRFYEEDSPGEESTGS